MFTMSMWSAASALLTVLTEYPVSIRPFLWERSTPWRSFLLTTRSSSGWCREVFEYESETVMMAPASGFYTTPGAGINRVRIAYVPKKKDLERALFCSAEGTRRHILEEQTTDMNFPGLFIARKIYNDKGDKHQVSRPAIRIATIGVAIGLAVMIISVSVVLGFKHTIRDKVIGFGSHITVAHFLALQQESSYPICIDDSLMNVLKGINDVKHVQRYAMKQGILKTDEDFMGVMFKGVSEEFDTTFIHENMVEGVIPKFSSKASSNKILISKMTAGQAEAKARR